MKGKLTFEPPLPVIVYFSSGCDKCLDFLKKCRNANFLFVDMEYTLMTKAYELFEWAEKSGVDRLPFGMTPDGDCLNEEELVAEVERGAKKLNTV